MAGKSSAASGPASFAEAMRNIVGSIADAMTVPDAAPHMAALMDMQKLAVAMTQHVGAAAVAPPVPPAGGAPPGPGGPPGGAMGPGGGTNLARLAGAPASGPSAGSTGPPSISGASADDVRRMTAVG